MKKKVLVLIERGADGSYGAFVPDNSPLPYGVIGDGRTTAEAKEDFIGVYKEMKALYDEREGKESPEYSFTFAYDIPSFLEYYTSMFTLVGLSRITGIAKGQLSHYRNGTSKPSAKTIKKIEGSLRQFGQEICGITLL